MAFHYAEFQREEVGRGFRDADDHAAVGLSFGQPMEAARLAAVHRARHVAFFVDHIAERRERLAREPVSNDITRSGHG